MATPKGKDTDHINGDTLDNRRCNLRVCSHQQNISNRKKQRNPTTSQYKGVHLDKARGKWHAKLRSHGRMVHIGYFTSEEDAAQAYNEAARKHFGEFARLNVIENATPSDLIPASLKGAAEADTEAAS
jgi:hypothetical protein